VGNLTADGERLLEWHISELEALFARCEPEEYVHPLVQARLIQAYEELMK
jgi:hypothetical protein